MNIVQITPGAGGMYCGNCFRDNALVAELRKLGHSTLMVPLYLPMTLDEEDQSAGTPIFFSGVNVYLEQKSALFRHAPEWLHKLLASPRLLKWAGKQAAKTRAEDVGDLTLSMLKGEDGNQARELDELIAFLKTQEHPDVICLSNAMLVGLVRQFKKQLKSKVVCMLQGEDAFLDAMPKKDRDAVWATLSERAQEVDLFIAPSRYFADNMAARMKVSPDKVKVVFNGINLEGWQGSETGSSRREEAHTIPGEEHQSLLTSAATVQGGEAPVLGFFARMSEEKGLHLLVDAFIDLKKRETTKLLKLKVGGGCGPSDEKYVAKLKRLLADAGVLADVEVHPNLDRDQKQAFFESLTLFSVPALYGEAFGLYLVEAMAAGVPVVQPRHAAFPEIVEASRAGIITEANSAALADGIESLLIDPERLKELRSHALAASREQFSIAAMAAKIVEALESITDDSRAEVPAS